MTNPLSGEVRHLPRIYVRVGARKEISAIIRKRAKFNCEVSSLVLLLSLPRMEIIDMNLSFEVTLKTVLEHRSDILAKINH